MILGVGNDLTDIARIERTLARFGERFERRCFTEGERVRAHRRREAGSRVIAGTYAKRYAAKEACAKALGTGLNQGVFWKDMEVVNLTSGQPALRLRGGALRRLEVITPPGMRPDVHLALTDEYPYAQATVIISAIAISTERV